MAELRDHGKCIVFSTHIMREAEKLCDRIAIMHRGCILAEGTLAEVRERYGRAGPRGIVLSIDFAARRSGRRRHDAMKIRRLCFSITDRDRYAEA